jgi:hypothetical protein
MDSGQRRGAKASISTRHGEPEAQEWPLVGVVWLILGVYFSFGREGVGIAVGAVLWFLLLKKSEIRIP